MRTIMHLSDLHFGRVDGVIVRALGESTQRLTPDLIAISGDVTQRARRREFAAARAFLDSLPFPKIVVPGNHDIPLYDLLARLLKPHSRYQNHFAMDMEPVFIDDRLMVVGINTARSLTFKGGRINHRQVERVRNFFCKPCDDRIRILITHHPFDLPPLADTHDLVGRAAMAMSGLSDCLPDLLLAGHLHLQGTGTTAARYQLGKRSAIVVQAGTATSTRVRGETNSLNVIHVDRDQIAVDRFDWSPDKLVFDFASTTGFVRRDGGWQKADVLRV